jgi:hypothetical protein
LRYALLASSTALDYLRLEIKELVCAEADETLIYARLQTVLFSNF